MYDIQPYEEGILYDDAYNDKPDYESDDSNDELNPCNDYPDSDHSEESIGDEDIRNAMKNLQVHDLSTDEDDNEFVYGLDEADVDRYGYEYARYKAKMKKEECGESNDSDDSDNSDKSDDSIASSISNNYDDEC